MTINNNLPKGWEVRTIDDVCDVIVGSTPLKSDKTNWENGSVPWFTVADIREQGREINYTQQFITEKALNKLTLLPRGTVLLCCTASVGEYAITEIELTTNQQFNGLVIKDENELSSRFLFLLSMTFKEKLLELSGKTTIDFVSGKKVKSIKIPVPPLPEQERIVSVLDGVFANIDNAINNTQQSLDNTNTLFQSGLQSILSNSDWKIQKLGDVCNLIGGGTPDKSKKEYYNGNIPWATVRDMSVDFISKTEHSITELGLDKSSSKVIPANNVIIASRVGLGKICIINQDTAINQDLRGVLPKNIEEIDIRYLFYWFKSISDVIINAGTGATVQGVKGDFLKGLKIPVPPIEEQKRIVQELDILSEKTKKLQTLYTQKLNHLKTLKKSTLQKAFRGEL